MEDPRRSTDRKVSTIGDASGGRRRARPSAWVGLCMAVPLLALTAVQCRESPPQEDASPRPLQLKTMQYDGDEAVPPSQVREAAVPADLDRARAAWAELGENDRASPDGVSAALFLADALCATARSDDQKELYAEAEELYSHCMAAAEPRADDYKMAGLGLARLYDETDQPEAAFRTIEDMLAAHMPWHGDLGVKVALVRYAADAGEPEWTIGEFRYMALMALHGAEYDESMLGVEWLTWDAVQSVSRLTRSATHGVRAEELLSQVATGTVKPFAGLMGLTMPSEEGGEVRETFIAKACQAEGAARSRRIDDLARLLEDPTCRGFAAAAFRDHAIPVSDPGTREALAAIVDDPEATDFEREVARGALATGTAHGGD